MVGLAVGDAMARHAGKTEPMGRVVKLTTVHRVCVQPAQPPAVRACRPVSPSSPRTVAIAVLVMNREPTRMLDWALILVPACRCPGATTAATETSNYLSFYFLRSDSRMGLLTDLGAHHDAAGRQAPLAHGTSGSSATVTALIIWPGRVPVALSAPFPESHHMVGAGGVHVATRTDRRRIRRGWVHSCRNLRSFGTAVKFQGT